MLANSSEALVMVKSFLSQDERRQMEAKADLETYSVTNHQNVVRLLGICKQCEPILAIYEYPEWVRVDLQINDNDCFFILKIPTP